ncbi:MAG: DEAD/DEAH box helicase family protein [Labilithrix sp.]|nr:DEAD/DEAH box helicase family protein [Labilithrix sp.]
MQRSREKAVMVLRPRRAVAPECASFADEASVVRFEREMRAHRARVEAFRVALGPVAGSFLVSGASGDTYAVDLVDQRDEHDACSCPDFLFGMLGACKHVAAVRRAAKESARVRGVVAALPRDACARDEVVITARAGVAGGPGPLGLVAFGRETERVLADLAALALGGGALERAGLGSASDEHAAAHVLLGPGGEIVASAAVLGHARDFRLARVTPAALSAARILEQRRLRGERLLDVGRALASGKLGVDVLAQPLFPYQREGVAHLVSAGRAVLADDMGLGKTVQTIAACEVLRRRGEARRVLVVCPASLKAQWASEIARYAGAQAVVIVGGVEARRAAFASDAPYVVLNYELTWRDLSLVKNLDADVLVLDEAQRAKNFRTKTAATLKSIPSRFLFVLTGTPVENRLDDLYGILQLVDGEVLGPLWKFNVDFHERDPQRGKILGYKNLAALRQTIAPVVLRRRKEAVLSQLPALTEQTRYVALTPEQAELEESYRRAAAMLVKIAERRPLNPPEQKRLQAALLKARQACNTALLCDPASTSGAPKLDELAALVGEIAEQGTSKVLVFSEWTEMLKLAAARLDALGVAYVMLHGGVPTAARPGLIERFKADEDKVVLLSTDAGGVGLNLQVASYVVHLDLPWNPARLDQRIARAHRLGQTRGVSVTYLCAETGIERGIEGTLAGKRAVRSAATDGASDVDALEAPTFTVFLRQARDILGADDERGGAGRAAASSDAHGEDARAKRGGPSAAAPDTSTRAPTEEPSAPSRSEARAGEGRASQSEIDAARSGGEASRAVRRDPRSAAALGVPDPRATEAFARQRLRLAQVVLDAGFPADAVRAAYEAIAAALRARLDAPIDDGHPALVAAIYRELLPSGAIPSTLPGVLAKIHDLLLLEEHALPIDAAIAAAAVEDARAWLEREDAFPPRARSAQGAAVAPSV